MIPLSFRGYLQCFKSVHSAASGIRVPYPAKRIKHKAFGKGGREMGGQGRKERTASETEDTFTHTEPNLICLI